jgi:hypothetical protein
VLFVLSLVVVQSKWLEEINLTIEESTVVIKTGDIFKQEGLKVIALMNTDTQVDERIIAQASLNGKFIREYCDCLLVN